MLETQAPGSDPIFMAMSTVPLSSHSASPAIEQIAAGTRRLLSQFAAVCPAEGVRRFVMQKIVQSPFRAAAGNTNIS